MVNVQQPSSDYLHAYVTNYLHVVHACTSVKTNDNIFTDSQHPSDTTPQVSLSDWPVTTSQGQLVRQQII